MFIMRGIATTTRNSVLSADDGGVSIAQTAGKRVSQFTPSTKTLYYYDTDAKPVVRKLTILFIRLKKLKREWRRGCRLSSSH
jgi:hypothetical protein